LNIKKGLRCKHNVPFDSKITSQPSVSELFEIFFRTGETTTMSRRYDSVIKDVGPLAQPLQFEFSGKSAPNRFLKAAMTERLSSWDPENKKKRGVPSEELIHVCNRPISTKDCSVLTMGVVVLPTIVQTNGDSQIRDGAKVASGSF
jgi:hypothetical protein